MTRAQSRMLSTLFHGAAGGIRIEGKRHERTAACLIMLGVARWSRRWYWWIWRGWRTGRCLVLTTTGRVAAEKLDERQAP